jgi:hypothetical protein
MATSGNTTVTSGATTTLFDAASELVDGVRTFQVAPQDGDIKVRVTPVHRESVPTFMVREGETALFGGEANGVGVIKKVEAIADDTDTEVDYGVVAIAL